MSQEEAFLRSVLADPADDTPRLVYADWLDDNGRPERAEFIRVQIERARLDEDDPRHDPLEERERGLLRAHENEWLGDAGRLLSAPEFRRGFVERGQLGARQFSPTPRNCSSRSGAAPQVAASTTDEEWSHGSGCLSPSGASALT